MNPTLLLLAGFALYAFSRNNSTPAAAVGAGPGHTSDPLSAALAALLKPKQPTDPSAGGAKGMGGGSSGGGAGFGTPGAGGQKTPFVDNTGDPFAPWISSAGGLSDGRVNTQNPNDLTDINANAPNSDYIDYLTGESAQQGQDLGDVLAGIPGPNVVLDPGSVDNTYVGDLGGYGDGYDSGGGGGDWSNSSDNAAYQDGSF